MRLGILVPGESVERLHLPPPLCAASETIASLTTHEKFRASRVAIWQLIIRILTIIYVLYYTTY